MSGGNRLKGIKTVGFWFFGLAFALWIGGMLNSPASSSAQFQETATATLENRNLLPLVRYPENTPTPTRTNTPTATATFTPTLTPTPTPTPMPIGPEGETFTAVVVDPQLPNVVYIGSYTSGVYRSTDTGLTWYKRSTGLTNKKIQSLAVHPSNSNIIYAGTYAGGLFKSTNAGESWVPSNGNELAGQIIYDIEIDAINPNTVYVTSRSKTTPTVNDYPGYLYKSSDGGASWMLLYDGHVFTPNDYSYDVTVHPVAGNNNKVYLTFHQNGYFKSYDYGATFQEINSGITDKSARSIVIDTTVPGLLYAGGWQYPGMFRSTSAGMPGGSEPGWYAIPVGTPTDAVKVGRIVLAPFGSSYQRVFICTASNGVMSSDTKGNSWVSRGLNGMMINDFDISGTTTQVWLAASQNNGVYRTTNYGANWHLTANGFATNTTGLVTMDDGKTLLAAVSGIGVLATQDEGQTWKAFDDGLESMLVFDLVSIDGQVFVLTAAGAYELEGETWIKLDAKSYYAGEAEGLMASLQQRIDVQEDLYSLELSALETHSIQKNQMKPVVFLNLISLNNHLLAGSVGQGLWCKTVSGWQQCGFEGKTINLLSRDIHGSQAVLQSCSPDEICKLYRGDGDTWIQVQAVPEHLTINDLLIINNQVWLATEAGLWRGADNSGAWAPAFNEQTALFAIASNPVDNCEMVAGGDGFVLLSRDCGQSWQKQLINEEGGAFQSILFVQGEQGRRLILGSKSGGTWLVPNY